jgi:hypothetical protein
MRVDALFRKTENRIKPLSIALGLGIALLGSRMADPAVTVAVRIIVVDGADEAARILLQLMGGADFAELARVKSTDATSVDGGFLGEVDPGMPFTITRAWRRSRSRCASCNFSPDWGARGPRRRNWPSARQFRILRSPTRPGTTSDCRNWRAKGWCRRSFIRAAHCRIIAFVCRTTSDACKKRFADRMGRDLELLSVTMDPVPTRRRR